MNYVILGRLLRSTLELDPIVAGRKLSFLSPRRITAIFVGSDILSFIIQGSGSGLTGSNNNDTVNLGLHILLGGMYLNLVSFTIFISMVVYFDYTTRQAYKAAGRHRDFYPIVCALYSSWLFIMVRSVFRVIEFANGWNGPIHSNETYFYVFDSSMMYPPFRN